MAVKTTTKPAVKTASLPQISVKIQKLFDEGSKIRAVANATIGGAFAIHGIKVIDSEKGLFLSMPSNSYKNGSGETKYQDIFHPVTAEARQALSDSVMRAYEKALAEQQSEDKSENESEDEDHVQSM
jgi:stage V sporulation protein G